MSSFQLRVRELRRAHNISQQQLADRLGVTMMTVHRWENGKARPSPLACILIEALEEIYDRCPLCHGRLK